MRAFTSLGRSGGSRFSRTIATPSRCDASCGGANPATCWSAVLIGTICLFSSSANGWFSPLNRLGSSSFRRSPSALSTASRTFTASGVGVTTSYVVSEFSTE